MTLATETAKSTRNLTYFVRIYTTPGTYSGANVLLQATDPTSASGVPGIDAIRISKSFDSPVPVCQFDLSRVPTWIRRGMGVTVDVGYNGLTQRLFTGFIQSRERTVGKGTVQCMGRLWTAFRTIEIGSRSVDGVTVSSAIGTILDYVGLTDNRSLTIPAFTLGTASSPVLERMPASQMLQMLMDVDGCRIYETGTGQIVIRVIDEAPAPVAYKTYTTNSNASARVLEASDREDPEYYRNRVIVTGATVVEGTAPDETSRTITATATNTGSQLVQPPLPSGTYIDAEYNNHLIDTDAKAAEVAIRLLAKFARIPRQLQIEIAGDPELELGQTLEFIMPELDLDDRGFISGIEHTIDGNGYVTRLTDFRGAGDTGGTLSQNPIAAFTFKSEIEVFGDVINVFAALDASNSFDPDGTIASYAWSDNQSTTPEIATLTTQQVTVRADTSAWTGSWDVTLTVTDNDGLTGSTTITIPYENDEPEIVFPAIFAAINNRHSASLNGAVSWEDQTVGSGNSISVGARPSDGVNTGHACYGTSTGRIYRTTDGCLTAPTLVYTTAAGVAINDIQWDWRNGNVVWAIDENAIVYISLNEGVTWVIYESLRTKLSLAGALGNKLGLPAAGGVYAFGGTGAGSPLIAYDPVVGSHQWTQVTFTGDLLTDTVTTPGDATLRIVDFTAGFSQDCLILSWASGGGASITAIYTSPSGGAPTRAFTRASTTFGGLKTGRYVVSDNVLIKSNYFIAAFANRSVWTSTDGVAWTEVTNVMPVGVTPWHCLGMTGSTELTGIVGMFGVFMIAASDGLYKYTPRIDATASYLRPSAAGETWPVGAIGKKLSIGASAASSSADSRLAATLTNVSPHTVTTLLSPNPSWSTPVAATGITLAHPGIFCTSEDDFFATNNDDNADSIGGASAISHTGGATWAAGTAGVYGVAKSATGRLWRFRRDTATFTRTLIDYSDDAGDNWTNVITIGNGTSVARRAIRIACHPTNPNIVAVWGSTGAGGGFTASATADPTSSGNWTTYTSSQPGEGQSGNNYTYQFAILANNRFVWAGASGASARTIQTSDNYGSSWTSRFSESNSSLRYLCCGVSGTKCVVMRDHITGSTGGIPLVSDDSGQTFAELGISSFRTALSLTGDADAAAYDPLSDTLYIFTDDGKVCALTPVTTSGVWSEITDSIASGTHGHGNIAVIPR